MSLDEHEQNCRDLVQFYMNWDERPHDFGAVSDCLKPYRLEMLPIPYIGDIMNATVYLLMLNPSYDPALPINASWSIHTDNLDQINGDPFFPAAYDYDGCYHQYWMRLLKPVVDELGGNTDPIVRRFAMVNLVPYRSLSFKETPGIFNLQSSLLAQKFARGIPADRLIIVARRPRVWNIPERSNVITFTGLESRGIHLHKHAKRIAMFLKQTSRMMVPLMYAYSGLKGRQQ
jgi:hypothetical protein